MSETRKVLLVDDHELVRYGVKAMYAEMHGVTIDWLEASSLMEAVETYRATLPARFKREAQILADATGWSQKDIEARMNANGQSMAGQK